jgi:hypothetical protein
MGGAGNDAAYGVGMLSDGTIAVAGYAETGFPVTPHAFQSTSVNGAAFVARLRIGGLFPPTPSIKVFSTFYGGSAIDMASALAVDGSDNIWIAGHTASTDLPLQSPVQSTFGGAGQSGLGDGLVARFTSAGSFNFGTYLGGSDGDSADAIAVDRAGDAYLTGLTQSANFPVRGAFLQFNGYDGFVTKLRPGRLLYSSYLTSAVGRGIAVNGAGEAFVSGFGQASAFTPLVPVPPGALYKAFLARVNAAGNGLIYGVTMAGSDLFAAAYAVAIDGASNAVVGGSSSSTTFPLQGPIQSANGGGDDAIVFKVSGQ